MLLCLLLWGCGENVVQGVGADSEPLAAAAQSPSAWGQVPAFRLTTQDDQELTLEDLRGKPFALAAIFTTCAGPCPMITINMLGLQEKLRDTGVRLISVSVDPETDTPEVLRAYAKSYGADTRRWTFLTGNEEQIFALLKGGLWLGVERAKLEEAVLGMQVSHAALIVAVDAEGKKRGWYDGTQPAALELLAERMRFLDGEQP